MDMWYGMSARKQYRKEEIGKENQWQAACIRNKRERERRPGFKVKVEPLVISAFGGGIKEILKELENVFEKDDLCERIVTEMQKTILMDSETIIRKVLSELIQSDWINSW